MKDDETRNYISGMGKALIIKEDKKMILELVSFFRNHKNAQACVVVFNQSGFSKKFDERSRSYFVHRNNNAFKDFQSNHTSNSIYGDCLDCSEFGVRLDWYNWKIESVRVASESEQPHY